MYHEVTDDPRSSGFQRAAALPYTYTRSAFAAHLDAIASASMTPQLVTDLPLGNGKMGRHLLLTFDDGGASARYAADQLESRGWRGHFFIVTARIGERTFLKRSDIVALRQAGHLVGTHSHTHPDIFRGLSPGMMVTEWRVSCAILEALLGEPCLAASVPGGDISRMVLESVGEAGVRYLFTSEPYLKPERVGATWVLGRVILKSGVSPATIHDLVAFRGWQRAQLVRRLTGWARALSPSLYRRYVRLRTRERPS
jgi:peptidoglycan/xylan/chitin deacetylase (PgdA/CDA1 family)